MAFELPELPYSQDALDPHISAKTLSFHYGKHHAAYVAKLNELIAGSALEGKDLDEIIKTTAGDAGKAGIFNNAAITQFGSGWAWLVQDGNDLAIVKTANAENPLSQGKHALFTVDVWEHAYYLDYQNRRPDFVQTVLDKLINWDFVSQNLK